MNGSPNRTPVKSILITQPKPENDRNPYADLARKFGLNIEFKPFIHLEPLSAKDFRKWRINPADFTAVVFTSRSAVDQFFKLCDELRVKVSADMKYYCMGEAIALYLQKYILYRKRKVFHGDGTFAGLTEIIEKHYDGEKFLVPCSDNHKADLSDYFTRKSYAFAEAVIFKTVPVQISEKELRRFDLVVFFTPAGVQAMKQNFPDFRQRSLQFGAFGAQTTQAAVEAGLKLSIQAPAPGTPSMTMAIESFLQKLS